MSVKLLTQTQKQALADQYTAEDGYSQADLAIQYGISTSTVRRTLAEFGLAKNNNEASPKERNLLNVLESFGINSTQRLSEVLQRGLQC